MSVPTLGGLTVLPLGHELSLPVSRKVRGWEGPGYQAKHGTGRKERGTSPGHSRVSSPRSNTVSSELSMVSAVPSKVLPAWDQVFKDDTIWYKVHKRDGVGPRLGRFGQPPVLQLSPAWPSPGIYSLLMGEVL